MDVDVDVAGAGIGALTLFVADVREVGDFYRDVLRLREVFADEVSVVFALGGTLLNVLHVSAAAEVVAPAEPAVVGSAPNALLTLWVEDVDAVCRQLEQRGAALLNGPVDRPWGKRTAAFRDPAGTVWEVAQDLA